MSQNEVQDLELAIEKMLKKSYMRVLWTVASGVIVGLVWLSVTFGDWREWRRNTDKRLDAVEMVQSSSSTAPMVHKNR